MTTKQQIGEAILKARGEMSKRQVAIQAGMTWHQIEAIETGSTNYTIESLMAVCKVVGLEVYVVMAGDIVHA